MECRYERMAVTHSYGIWFWTGENTWTEHLHDQSWLHSNLENVLLKVRSEYLIKNKIGVECRWKVRVVIPPVEVI